MQQLHTLKDIEQAIATHPERHRTGHRHTPFSITVHQSPNLRCLYGRGRPA